MGLVCGSSAYNRSLGLTSPYPAGAPVLGNLPQLATSRVQKCDNHLLNSGPLPLKNGPL